MRVKANEIKDKVTVEARNYATKLKFIFTFILNRLRDQKS